MSHTVTIREDARAMRQAKGQHTVSEAEYAALVGDGTASLRAANEAPDGYAIALAKQRMSPSIPSPRAATDIPDGYKIALDNLARQTSTPAPAPAPASSTVAPDGYAIALTEQRKEKK